jgi:glycosyltransferase involved in cell wall biosynthesis
VERRPVKTALLTNFIPPYRVPLLQELQDRGSGLRVFVSTRMESDRTWDVEWGRLDVTVQRTVTLGRRYRDRSGFSRRLEIHVPYDTLPRLTCFRPDCVISAELGMRSLQAAAYRLARPSSSLIIWATLSEHSERAWGAARKALRRFILRAADGVLVNGESGARYIRRFGVPDSRIFRVNQPVDVSMFAAHRRRGAGNVSRLLFSGALTPRKGLPAFQQAIAAWARLNPERCFELWWVGDGSDRSELSGTDLPPTVLQRFFGDIAYSRLPEIYAEADILVLPTLMDEWGLVVNEAMATGLPVLGSIYSQAVEELVVDGVNGWRFDPLNPAGVSAALDRVFSAAPAVVAGMRDAACQRVNALTPAAAADMIMEAVHLCRPIRGLPAAWEQAVGTGMRL